MRVSEGFCVTGLSGKKLIRTLPPRRVLRVIAMRAASIWRLVTQPASSALRPKSPACTVVCPFDVPRRRPRWYLRNLVFLGRSTYDRPFFEPLLPEPAPLVFSAAGSPDWSSFVGSSTCFFV